MSNPSGFSYSSPSAPSSSSCPPQIGFKTTISNPILNMSGYPSYPNQGGVPPAYPPTPGYSPYNTGQQQPYSSAYPSSNPSYPSYPPAPSAAPYGSSPYPSPQSAGGYPPAPYSQPQGYGQPAPGYSSGYPSQPGYPATSYPSMQQPSGYMSQAQQSGPQYPGMSQQPSYQNYAQSYGAPGVPPSAHNPYYPAASPYTTSSPYSSSSPYSTSTTGGYNINQGTIVPYNPFNSKTDAEGLRKAMKGLGTDEKAVIRILCNRTYAQRAQIALDYKTLFGKDLVNNLKDELGGNLEDVIVALMLPRANYLVRSMRSAISGIGTAELTLVEILCTSTNAEIREINSVYKLEYKKTLESDLRGDTSGYFKRLLVSLNVGNRDENPSVNHGQAVQDAQRLFQAGEGRWGTDESIFNSILVSQSFAQLKVVFQEYERISHRTIEAALQNEMSGDLLIGMLAVVKCVRNRSAYFAERLRNSLKGAGTIDNTLIRIIVSRSEIDLKTIRDDYQRMYGRSLAQDISDDTSGDYKRVLLEIVK